MSNEAAVLGLLRTLGVDVDVRTVSGIMTIKQQAEVQGV